MPSRARGARPSGLAEKLEEILPVLRLRKAVLAEPDGLAAACKEQGVARVGGNAVRLNERPVVVEIRIAQFPLYSDGAAA